MRPQSRPLRRFAAASLVRLTLTGVLGTAVLASDHSDPPELYQAGRLDANLLNFHAFTTTGQATRDMLVLALHINNAIPPQLLDYWFAEDLTFEFHVDNHSAVIRTEGSSTPTDYDRMMRFGGSVLDPDKINDDITFKIKFEPTHDGRTTPKVVLEGLPSWGADEIRLFPRPGESALRRAGAGTTSVAALVLEIPLALVINSQDTLLLWATSKVPEVHGPISDHIGLPNTSRFNLIINRLRPRFHTAYLVTPPSELPRADVLIFDTAKPAQFPAFDVSNPATFPNGRPPTVMTLDFPYLPAPV